MGMLLKTREVSADTAFDTRDRRWPIGAEIVPQRGVHFRVWAPRPKRVEVVLIDAKSGREAEAVALEREASGYHSGLLTNAGAGSLYGFRLDGSEQIYPDPMSRFQPDGPHGPSQVIDPAAFAWTDRNWPGIRLRGQVLYEMHLGTFTREGTFQAAAEQLAELADLGVTVVEVMPVADFPGRFGWGYDGVSVFAPKKHYGTPDDFRAFVNRAHALKLGVILDVVYNHLGPDGNYLPLFSTDYFRQDLSTDWGPAINFGGENSGPVRELFATNAAYWIDEYHLDGLRLDATQDIHDEPDTHILADITRAARKAAGRRSIIITAENEPQETRLARPLDAGGYGIDGLWNDDFHHSAMVVLSGHNEAYYTDYFGKPQEFISALKHGYLYQGQRYEWQEKQRGTSTRGLAPETFITFIQNHDQVANSARGWRCHRLSSPGRFRAITALMLLGPGTPLLFQGQEFASSSPFYFFADHNGELAPLVARGRREFMTQFPSVDDPAIQKLLPNPADPKTLEACRLDFSERNTNRHIYDMHRDLLKLRRDDPVISAQGLDGAVLAEEAFVIRFFAADDEASDRLLIVNLGRDVVLSPAPEPLLAPPPGGTWKALWSSEDPKYGGCGRPPLAADSAWRLPGHAAVLLHADLTS
jgi:maltooligosyltrehalose trehalohydrolase